MSHIDETPHQHMMMHTNEEMTSYVVCSRAHKYIDVLVLHPDGKLELTKESKDKNGIDVTDGNIGT